MADDGKLVGEGAIKSRKAATEKGEEVKLVYLALSSQPSPFLESLI